VQEVVIAAQADDHSDVWSNCSSCGGLCHVKDWRLYRVARLFGAVTVRPLRFQRDNCARSETSFSWPRHFRSTTELDQLRAHLSALMARRAMMDQPLAN